MSERLWTDPPPANLVAGWKPDPSQRYAHRYWDGRQWTDRVSDGGSVKHDAESSAADRIGVGGIALSIVIPIAGLIYGLVQLVRGRIKTGTGRSRGLEVVGHLR